MRHGELTVVQPVTRTDRGPEEKGRPFLLVVADEDGAFPVIGSEWVHERWAGAAPVEPSTAQHMRHVQGIMLREAERRRHDGIFDDEHPMLLESVE